METHARYVLIGSFTLAGILGMVGLILWFASVEIDRQFAYYDIDFSSVSGLSNASDVRFNGFPVGQVVNMSLAEDDSGMIRVRIEVDADTPIRTGSVATVEALGVTGVGFVGISAGDPRLPLLREASGDGVPEIEAGLSVVQTLSQDGPQILSDAADVVSRVRDILGDENAERVTAILTNLEASSADLGQALDDFSAVTSTVAQASAEIGAFTGRLETIASTATTALETADTTLQQVTALAARAEGSLDTVDTTLESGRRALDTADAFIADELPALVDELAETAASIGAQLDLVAGDARAMLQEFRTTGSLASDRLTQAEATIAAADAALAQFSDTLGAVAGTSDSLTALVEGDGAALVADWRGVAARADALILSATSVAEEDLPAIVADVRTATATAAQAVEQVSADLSRAAGRVDGISAEAETALATVADTFTRANDTLAILNSAIETGESALAAADTAFSTADEVMRTDVAAIADELRAMLGRLDGAVERVSTDLPEITANLRSTAERANAALGEFQRAVAAASGPVQEFAGSGLPQYTRLAREARELIQTLEQLVRNIERDPARYFFGGDEPVYRR